MHHTDKFKVLSPSLITIYKTYYTFLRRIYINCDLCMTRFQDGYSINLLEAVAKIMTEKYGPNNTGEYSPSYGKVLQFAYSNRNSVDATQRCRSMWLSCSISNNDSTPNNATLSLALFCLLRVAISAIPANPRSSPRSRPAWHRARAPISPIYG